MTCHRKTILFDNTYPDLGWYFEYCGWDLKKSPEHSRMAERIYGDNLNWKTGAIVAFSTSRRSGNYICSHSHWRPPITAITSSRRPSDALPSKNGKEGDDNQQRNIKYWTMDMTEARPYPAFKAWIKLGDMSMDWADRSNRVRDFGP